MSDEGITPMTVPNLTKFILDRWEEKRKEAELLQKKSKKELEDVVQKEASLQAPLKKARRIVATMQKDYHSLEEKTKKEKKAQIERDAVRADDVQAGRVSLREFAKAGKSEASIAAEAVEKSVAELTDSLEVIRAKNLEILKLEKELAETQNKIRGLMLRPVKILYQVFKDLADITDREHAEFLAEVQSSRTALEQINHKLLLCDGKSMSDRYTWSGLTMAKAQALAFSPLLPVECIPKLKADLALFEGVENITVSYFLRTKDVQVSSLTARRGLIQTGDIPEAPDAPFKREKKEGEQT